MLVAASAFAQRGPAYRAPRAPDGHPDLSGIWQTIGTADQDLQAHPSYGGPYPQIGSLGAVPADRGVVEGGMIPYKPEALAKKNENFANRWKLDPEVKCYMPGIPRATYMPFPFQIVQSANVILMSYEYASANRVINMGKPVEAQVDTWMGTPNGHWEGETLVVDNTGLQRSELVRPRGRFSQRCAACGRTFHARGRGPHQLRSHHRRSADVHAPWKISLPLYRRVEKNAQMGEFKCVEYVEELFYGDLRKKKIVGRFEMNHRDYLSWPLAYGRDGVRADAREEIGRRRRLRGAIRICRAHSAATNTSACRLSGRRSLARADS